METLPRAVCSAALLLSGTALLLVGLLTSASNLGIIVAACGLFPLLLGLYGCLRTMGIKLYSGQEACPGEQPAARSA